jgi:DDE family transposase
MERELWPPLYRLLREVGKQHRQKYVQYQPWVIVAVLLWAALHDRTVAWACQARHWSTTTLRPLQLPSDSTIDRRVDTVGVGLLWRALEERLRASGEPALVAFVDGKPLPVGGNSKDRDARFGRGAGVIAKGYKLHAIWTTRALPEAWTVTPLNANEKAVAEDLVGQLRHGGYLLADGNYDASYLYDAAWERGYQLVAPCREAKNPGSGKHYQSPHRRRSLALLDRDWDKAPQRFPWYPAFGQALYRTRTSIERSFGHATVFAGGLSPLPAWVRGSARVRTWVWAKLLINAVRIQRLKHKDL